MESIIYLIINILVINIEYLDYFIYLFVLIDIEKKTKILEKINFER